MFYNYYGYPYSSYIHYLKKREAPAEDQQTQESALLYSGFRYPYSYGYPMYYLKK